jgi:hypothetical protein
MSFMGFWNFSVIAHELAHQWFGDFVTLGSYSDIWLNEGWAEYLAGLSIERLRPSDWSGEKAAKLNAVTSLPDGSVYVPDTTDVNRIFDGRLTYYKGFYLVHMLRWLVGDSVFFQAARDYLYDPAQANGFARTADLQRHFETASGRDLDGFFADWFYGEGFPSYTVNWIQEQDSVILWIDQTQSHPSVPYYEMPLHIIAYRFGVIADTVLDHTYDHQRFSIYVGNNQISQLIFDQDKWILSKNNKVIKLTTPTHDVTQPEIQVTPNPANDYMVIIPGTDIQYAEFVSASGVVNRKPVMANKLSIQDLPGGAYLLRLLDDHDHIRHAQAITIVK